MPCSTVSSLAELYFLAEIEKEMEKWLKKPCVSPPKAQWVTEIEPLVIGKGLFNSGTIIGRLNIIKKYDFPEMDIGKKFKITVEEIKQ